MDAAEAKLAKATARRWARSQPGIRSAEQYVLEKMVLPMDPAAGNTAYPSAEWVASRVNLSEKQVRTIWRALVSWGLVTAVGHKHRCILWQFNTGVTIGKDQRKPQAPVGRRARKALPEVGTMPPCCEALIDRNPVPATPEASSEVGLRNAPPPSPEGGSEQTGSQFRSSPEAPSDKGRGPGEAGGSGGEVAPLETGRRLVRQHLPNGERRTAPRGNAVVEIPCRDMDVNGKAVWGRYAVAQEQLQMLKDLHPELDDHPVAAQFTGNGNGVIETLKVISGKYQQRAQEDPRALRTRADMPRRLMTWLAEDSARLLRKAKQTTLLSGASGEPAAPMPTGTEGR